MQVDLIAVGKIKEKYVQAGIYEYLKRIKPYARLNLIEVSDESIPPNPSAQEEEAVKELESQRILARLKPDTYLITLEIKGRLLTSEGLAKRIQTLALAGRSHLTFVIGGSVGLSSVVSDKADLQLSFGRFTYPHQLMRMILLEQIYRSFKIIKGEPYHK